MNPYFQSPKQIFLLSLFWGILSAILAVLQTPLTGWYWYENIVLFVPPLILMLYISLSSWYLCKNVNYDKNNLISFISIHLVSAGSILGIFLIITMAYSRGLNYLWEGVNWQKRYHDSIPIFLTFGFFFYFLICLFNYLILILDRVRKSEKKILENGLVSSKNELKTLQATIHPHFLFNSLTALSALTVSNPIKAQEVSLQLSDFMRYSLRYSQKKTITVNDEVEHIRNYLGIEQIRLGNRLKLDLNIDPAVTDLPVIPLLLLPLLENAVKHGIQEIVEGGMITLIISDNNGFLMIEVKNPFDDSGKKRPGEGLGLKTLRKRLQNEYGENAEVIISNKNMIYKVKIKIPIAEIKRGR